MCPDILLHSFWIGMNPLDLHALIPFLVTFSLNKIQNCYSLLDFPGVCISVDLPLSLSPSMWHITPIHLAEFPPIVHRCVHPIWGLYHPPYKPTSISVLLACPILLKLILCPLVICNIITFPVCGLIL